MADIQIGYFLEDIGQREFLLALVARVAEAQSVPPGSLISDVRNATGGRGKALGEFRLFLREMWGRFRLSYDILVVAVDSNCASYQERRNEIAHIVEQVGYPRPVVCAVPDPHIERWYLADPAGLRHAIGAPHEPAVPAYKCERRWYKQALLDIFRAAGLSPQAGGAEYGGDIAAAMDLYLAGKTDSALKHFVDDLRAVLTSLVREGNA